jgi:hypothetical protein
MKDSERYKLLHGPYHPPRYRVGTPLFCEMRGSATVRGISAGRIPWPETTPSPHGAGVRCLILCGDLVRAVKQESNQAVAYWWGVSGQTVTQWRKALGVQPRNEGTMRLYRDWAPERLPSSRSPGNGFAVGSASAWSSRPNRSTAFIISTSGK